MRRALFNNVSLYYYSRTCIPSPKIQQNLIPRFNLRLFNSESDSSNQNPNPSSSPPPPNPTVKETSLDITHNKKDDIVSADVSNQEFKSRVDKYFKGDEEALPTILEAVLSRKLSGKHEDTDDEITEDLRFAPLDTFHEGDFESDFSEAIDTDEDIPNMCAAKDVMVKRMVQDEYFNMDDKKWDAMVDEATQKGLVMDTKDCAEILEDMLYWEKLLPEDIKEKVQAKYDELGEKLENNELEAEEAYEQFKVFEDEIVSEHIKKDEEERLQESDEVEVAVPVDTKSDDPPGVGPILRWQQRLVFNTGGDAWHPKNRKVKLSVTVKELGLSKYQFRRLREIVGKRYHSGKDELTITSERYEQREENRKDCLRTLLSIVEEAGKADALVDETRTAYVKQRLKANPAFMARLHAKKTKQAASAIQA